MTFRGKVCKLAPMSKLLAGEGKFSSLSIFNNLANITTI